LQPLADGSPVPSGSHFSHILSRRRRHSGQRTHSSSTFSLPHQGHVSLGQSPCTAQLSRDSQDSQVKRLGFFDFFLIKRTSLLIPDRSGIKTVKSLKNENWAFFIFCLLFFILKHPGQNPRRYSGILKGWPRNVAEKRGEDLKWQVLIEASGALVFRCIHRHFPAGMAGSTRVLPPPTPLPCPCST
jgi:hypothetical protein